MKKIVYSLIYLFILSYSFTQTEIVFNTSETYFTCSAFLIASGGQGNSQYSNNEDNTITICPDNPDDVISITFNTFALDETDDNPAVPNTNPNNVNLDEMLVYDGANTSANFLGNYTGDGLQSTVIKATAQNPTGCITLRFISNSIGIGMFTASVSCTTPCDDPVAGGVLLNGITQDSIHVCVGEFVQFQEVGSFAQNGFNIASYQWDFADGFTSNSQSTTHAYNEAGYYRVQLYVTDDNGCTNNNLIDLDVKVATFPDFELFMRDSTICVGESLRLVAEPLLYENTWTSAVGSIEIENGCMYDTMLGVSQDLELVQTFFISGSTITNINQIESICMDMEHSFIGDLVITLYCPNGQSVVLHQQGGGGTFLGEAIDETNIDCNDPSTIGVPYNYCFTVGAAETWVEYVENNNWPGILPAGDYASVEPLDQLVGCPTNGVWTLSVVDNWGVDDGKVFSFSLNLSEDLYGEIVEFTPQHSTATDSSYWHFPASYASDLSADADSMTVTPLVPGVFNYHYTVYNDFGCANDTSVTVTVFQVAPPFVMSDVTECAETPFNVSGDFQPCTYTIRLEDSYGDSWNGNTVDITNNGNTSNYTVDFDDNGGDFLEIPIVLNQNDQITFQFNATGDYVSECIIYLLDCNGEIVYQNGGDWEGPVTTPETHTVNMQSTPPGYAFVWTPSEIFDDPNSSSPIATITSPTLITMAYYPIEHPLCVVYSTMMANINPDAYAGYDSIIDTCYNLPTFDLTPLLGQGISMNGVWTDPNGNTVTMPIDVTQNIHGDYIYAVGDGTCFDQATVNNQIRYEDSIVINYLTDPHICIGDTSIFVNQANLQNIQNIFVTIGDTTPVFDIGQNFDTIVHLYPFVGTYNTSFHTISTNGCQYFQDFLNVVNVHSYPVADFTYYPEQITMLNPELTVTNNSVGALDHINWYFSNALTDTSSMETQMVTYPFESGLFPITLIVTDTVGCIDSITKLINIDEVALFYFANSFTPNGDEFNQDWKIFVSGVDIKEFNLKIYDRWGNIVFESNDPNVGWDGSFSNSGYAPTGTYIWKLEATEKETHLRFKKEGYVNLLK
ncbi:MAG: gliding motility-associated C-terminal domain-containing protein [Flavobacteriia bacterium]|nr:gliding motility-associated C-terminal domain-containing protein [Flavobacteriia bacterium]